MTRYILDTDHVTLHQHSHPAVMQRLAQAHRDEVAVTIITVEEQLRGRLDIIRRYSTTPRQVQAYEAFQATLRYFQGLPIIPFGQSSLDTFQHLRRQGVRIGSQDLRIAVIALNIGATVVTRNLRDFAEVPGLLIDNWANS